MVNDELLWPRPALAQARRDRAPRGIRRRDGSVPPATAIAARSVPAQEFGDGAAARLCTCKYTITPQRIGLGGVRGRPHHSQDGDGMCRCRCVARRSVRRAGGARRGALPLAHTHTHTHTHTRFSCRPVHVNFERRRKAVWSPRRGAWPVPQGWRSPPASFAARAHGRTMHYSADLKEPMLSRDLDAARRAYEQGGGPRPRPHA